MPGHQPRSKQIRISLAKQWQAICWHRYTLAQRYTASRKFDIAIEMQELAHMAYIRMEFYLERANLDEPGFAIHQSQTKKSRRTIAKPIA